MPDRVAVYLVVVRRLRMRSGAPLRCRDRAIAASVRIPNVPAELLSCQPSSQPRAPKHTFSIT